MATADQEHIRWRLDATAQEVEELDKKIDGDNGISRRLTEVEIRLSDLVSWLKIGVGIVGSLLITILSILIAYLISHGGA